MFRPTSSQRPMFGAEALLSKTKRERLERSWAHQYRTQALRLIDETRFAKYFDEGNGRPNKSVRMVVSLLVLKEVFDLTDRETLEQLEWNAAWQYALELMADEAHTCQKTLHNFRALLLGDDQGAGLFESTTARLIKAAGIRTGRQRQDSTHVLSNIKLLTRLGLFVQTITQFLEALRKEHPRLCATVAEDLRERYLDREGYFADSRGSEAPRRLAQAAVDVHSLWQHFAEHRTVSAMPSFVILGRLYRDQCVPPTSEQPDKIELQESPSSSSLQSPSDPDVRYGHKGKGYEAQLTETCVEENEFQVVTSVSVNDANQSDQQQMEPALEQVERTCGEAPEAMIADAGYASGENILAAEEHGTELLAPIGSKESQKHLPLGQFEFDAAGERVLKCPAGEVPTEHQATRTGTAMLAFFAISVCSLCPLRDQCPTKERRGGMRALKFTRADVAVARRRVEQQTPEFKEQYKIRSGIEATNSQLKRCHGLAKLRVRRRPRVGLAVRLKVLALNIKRFVVHLVESVTPPTAKASACAR